MTSSTSNFEFSPYESVGNTSVPWAFLGLLLTIALIETLAWKQRIWFADEAAWYWQTKAQLIEEGELNGNVLILGSSVSFHAIDCSSINRNLPNGVRVANLALNGCQEQHRYQILRRYMETHSPPSWVVIELFDAELPERSWNSGPYWRFWALPGELSARQGAWMRPEDLLHAMFSRILATYAYRRSLNNWLHRSVANMKVETFYKTRNSKISYELNAHNGYFPGRFIEGLSSQSQLRTTRFHPFHRNTAGERWISDILEGCNREGIRVAFLYPPVPKQVDIHRRMSGFYRDRDQYVATLRKMHPSLQLCTFKASEKEVYPLECFSDDHHLSSVGSMRLSHEITNWISLLFR